MKHLQVDTVTTRDDNPDGKLCISIMSFLSSTDILITDYINQVPKPKPQHTTTKGRKKGSSTFFLYLVC